MEAIKKALYQVVAITEIVSQHGAEKSYVTRTCEKNMCIWDDARSLWFVFSELVRIILS